MLGNFTKGMLVKIPARFQTDSGKPVPVENVVVRIEHYDDVEKTVIHDLESTSMKQLSPSDYLYEYTVPATLKVGSYIVHISAKVPQNNNRVFEALEEFNVVTSLLKPVASGGKHFTALKPNGDTGTTEQNEPEKVVGVAEVAKPTINNSNDFYDHKENVVAGNKIVEDFVVDVENKPIPGVHLNVYLKNNFVPGNSNNVKVSSAMTDEKGRWRMSLPVGEYVFVYKGIGFKENREFMKVQ